MSQWGNEEDTAEELRRNNILQRAIILYIGQVRTSSLPAPFSSTHLLPLKCDCVAEPRYVLPALQLGSLKSTTWPLECPAALPRYSAPISQGLLYPVSPANPFTWQPFSPPLGPVVQKYQVVAMCEEQFSSLYPQFVQLTPPLFPSCRVG